MSETLDQLTHRAQRELRMTAFPHRQWTNNDPSRGHRTDVEVLIVGAGQCGLAVGLGLTQKQITSIALIDAKPEGLQGPWSTYARMKTLRSNPEHPGPALGNAALYYESWHRACFGDDDWDALHRIPVANWQSYLRWFKSTVDLPVSYETTVVDIAWSGEHFDVTLRSAGGETSVTSAGRIVVATGIEGSGPWRVPAAVAANVDPGRYSLVSDDIDFDSLAGKRLAIIGGGASAYDHAARAMECHAQSADILFRRRDLHRVNPHHWTEFHGFLDNFAALPDATRLDIMRHIIPANEPPPTHTFVRATASDGVNVLLGEDASDIEEHGEIISIGCADGRREYDHLIIAIGTQFDPSTRAELSSLLPYIASWRDVIGDVGDDPIVNALLDAPYLGPDMQYTGKDAAADHIIGRVYNLTGSATLSHGPSGTSINGLRPAAERIAHGISREVFTDDATRFVNEVANYDTPELTVHWPDGQTRLRATTAYETA